ncbi:MAG: ATP-binding protein [Firmicutes bacterium]|nr:ATP-binding protein [Bacillota bacterium]
MLGKIIYMNNTNAHVLVNEGIKISTNIMNMHVIFEDTNKKVLGEIEDIEKNMLRIKFLGEIENDKFIGGVIRKPTMEANIRMINAEELKIIVGEKDANTFTLGNSALYDGYPIMTDINDFFSNHLAIFGNSGSGKSCGVARVLQNIFTTPEFVPHKANIFIFDTYGEYHNAFTNFSSINPSYKFKYYTTNKNDVGGQKLQIPIWLLDVDDIAVLLNATNHAQMPIIERVLKLVRIFASDGELATKYKNHLIASAIMNILYTNQTATSKKNDIFNIFNTCTTNEFNPEAVIQGAGYTRKFRECFLINDKGNFSESVLLSEYVSSFIDDELNNYQDNKNYYFTLLDLEKALNFTMISEGLLKNEKQYDAAISLKVRLHSIIISEYATYFDMPQYMTKDQFVASLISSNNQKAQIINFNLEDVEDWFTKFVTKSFVKLLFNYVKNLPNRAVLPFHIFLEEAHRYVQNDNDTYLLGYNIFDRVAKEGRKYGLMLCLISQRPVELSDTVVSQVANFLIFKITHPLDVDYIQKMLPNISNEIVEKQKSLQPGTCMAFGRAFKIPMIVRMQLPDPLPASSNCNILETWK